MRPWRMGISSGIRPALDSSSSRTGSGRLCGGFQTACELRGTFSRSRLPIAYRSATDSCDLPRDVTAVEPDRVWVLAISRGPTCCSTARVKSGKSLEIAGKLRVCRSGERGDACLERDSRLGEQLNRVRSALTVRQPGRRTFLPPHPCRSRERARAACCTSG